MQIFHKDSQIFNGKYGYRPTYEAWFRKIIIVRITEKNYRLYTVSRENLAIVAESEETGRWHQKSSPIFVRNRELHCFHTNKNARLRILFMYKVIPSPKKIRYSDKSFRNKTENRSKQGLTTVPEIRSK